MERRSALTDLLTRKKECRECSLCATRRQVVLPVYPDPWEKRVMFIARNPGRTEDEKGEPLVGRAGQEFNAWLAYLGWRRIDCVLENVVGCYTPDDREPETLEIVMCRRWLSQEILLFQPSLIVALGATAQQTINANGKHGELVLSNYGPTYLLWHPSFLCRCKTPELERSLHKDLDGLKMAIKHREEIDRYKAMYNE